MKRLLLRVILLLSWSYCCTCKAQSVGRQLGADSLFLRQLCDTVMSKQDKSDSQVLFKRLLDESRKRRNTYYVSIRPGTSSLSKSVGSWAITSLVKTICIKAARVAA